MNTAIAGSFRDPSGFLFEKNGILYRQINSCYRPNYEVFMNSGLYRALVRQAWLIPHEEIEVAEPDNLVYKVIQPERIDMISYPYEWSFSQLKDAALLTLDIQRMALQKNLSLKDASAYNVQFHKGRPIFIDTLSFERYQEGEPWVAYRQFCQHFLAPLALMAKTDISLNQLLVNNIDGIPLSLAGRLLPFKTRFSISLGLHIHLHARSQIRNAGRSVTEQFSKKTFSKKAFIALIDSLRTSINSLKWVPENTEWIDYYDANNNYQDNAMASKDRIVDAFMQRFAIHIAWDLGANTGRFSRIAAKYCKMVCAWDIDTACVELNYLACRQKGEEKVLPLLLNLATPSPAIGWGNSERMSLQDRGPADMVLALGLIHHLSISHNLPLEIIARFLAKISNKLIIEFVQKEDSQVKKLLQNRKDIFPGYEQDNFERIFRCHFDLIDQQPIPDSRRTVYLFSTRHKAN